MAIFIVFKENGELAVGRISHLGRTLREQDAIASCTSHRILHLACRRSIVALLDELLARGRGHRGAGGALQHLQRWRHAVLRPLHQDRQDPNTFSFGAMRIVVVVSFCSNYRLGTWYGLWNYSDDRYIAGLLEVIEWQGYAHSWNLQFSVTNILHRRVSWTIKTNNDSLVSSRE
jgi:hypothetical protein